MPPSVATAMENIPWGGCGCIFFMRTLISIVPVDGIVNFCLPVQFTLEVRSQRVSVV